MRTSLYEMRRLILVLVLVGCAETAAAPPTSRWSAPREGHHYLHSEKQIDDRVYQLTFEGPAATEAQQRAIRRAAEIAHGRRMAAFLLLSADDQPNPFMVGGVRRSVPTKVITVQLLTATEYRALPPGVRAYVTSTGLGFQAPPDLRAAAPAPAPQQPTPLTPAPQPPQAVPAPESR
jgi:hypothetical protein